MLKADCEMALSRKNHKQVHQYYEVSWKRILEQEASDHFLNADFISNSFMSSCTRSKCLSTLHILVLYHVFKVCLISKYYRLLHFLSELAHDFSVL